MHLLKPPSMTLVSNPNGMLQGILQVFIIMTNVKLTDPPPLYQGREEAAASGSRCHIYAQLEGKAVTLFHPACLVISLPLVHRQKDESERVCVCACGGGKLSV